MKKLWPWLLSLLLLLPARIGMMLFVFAFASITGQELPGYILSCLLFGSLAALPVLLPVIRKPMTAGRKILRMVLLVGLYALILFMTSLSVGPRPRPEMANALDIKML